MEKNSADVDEFFMKRALQLAAQGEGRVGFRPMVGCVLVKDGEVIAETPPTITGVPHVEALALEKAGEKARGATVYVNLEPCAWHKEKQAPACCEALVKAGVARVVCAMRDPHPKINGAGIEFLEKNGVIVESGVLEGEARKLNEAWEKYAPTKIPFVVLKMACTLDGKIFSEKTRGISNEEERRFVHELRNKYQAILVGVNTVLEDDPQLTCRMAGGRDPLRVIVDSKLRAPVNARVFKDGNAVVFTTDAADNARKKSLGEKGIRVFSTGEGEKVNLRKALETLGEMKVASVMVEGGSKIAGSFLNEKLVDKMVVAVAPKIFGNGVTLVTGLQNEVVLEKTTVTALGDNAVLEGYPKY